MASGISGVTTDISSQLHAKGGPKANELQATKHDAQNTGKKLNQVLKENHKKILSKITTMTKEEIADSVPETTMVSTYVEIKKLFKTKEASKNRKNAKPKEKTVLTTTR